MTLRSASDGWTYARKISRSCARAEEAVDADAVHFFGRLSEPELQELHRLLARLSGRSD